MWGKNRRYAFIGAGAVITKNVKEYALIVGVPGVQIGWMSEYGERIELPIEGGNGEEWTDDRGSTYKINDGTVKRMG